MSLSVVGNKVYKDGKPIDQGTSHGDAVRAAQSRVKPGKSMSLEPTANVTIALDFKGAAEYVSVVDPKAAMAADVAAEGDSEAVAKLLKRKPADVLSAHQIKVRAKANDGAFQHNGAAFADGDFIVAHPGGKVEALPAEEFLRLYEPINIGKASKSSAPSQN